MKFGEEINLIGWLILFICVGMIYFLFVIIFKLINEIRYAWMGITLGAIDLIFLLYIFIKDIRDRQKEFDENEKQKTWIDRVCEKGF
jgi:NADH:ubiquinone oxidoreductase subunit 4 (subunit M)